LKAGDLVCLVGELGTGKTTLAQGIGRGLGVVGPITSPSYTLIAEYRLLPPTPPLYHIDVYRLGNPVEEALDLGLDEYLMGEGICLIEWADRIQPALPQDRLWVTLRHIKLSKRSILMEATNTHYDVLLRDFRQSAFGI
jgi:tRNA threonylcarbamoyladenosine biosynthesis protein TsaE